MNMPEFQMHLENFHREFDIDTSPEARANKLTREMLEFLHAHEQGTSEQADDEAVDVMVCAIANVMARGIKNPLWAGYLKLERTAVKYRLRKLEGV